MSTDLLVLAVARGPNENKRLFEMFKVPVSNEGFLIEAHANRGPYTPPWKACSQKALPDHPKPIDETITQAKAAAKKAQ